MKRKDKGSVTNMDIRKRKNSLPILELGLLIVTECTHQAPACLAKSQQVRMQHKRALEIAGNGK